MPTISVGITKIPDEREKCDTRCVLMKWSNSEVQLRQYKMPIISVRYNENNRWKRNAKKKDWKKQSGQKL